MWIEDQEDDTDAESDDRDAYFWSEDDEGYDFEDEDYEEAAFLDEGYDVEDEDNPVWWSEELGVWIDGQPEG